MRGEKAAESDPENNHRRLRLISCLPVQWIAWPPLPQRASLSPGSNMFDMGYVELLVLLSVVILLVCLCLSFDASVLKQAMSYGVQESVL